MSITVGQRLTGIKKWLYENACKGRTMKAEGERDLEIIYREPLAKLLLFTDEAGLPAAEYGAPAILVLMKESGMRDTEKRFDQYNHMKRPKVMGGMLSVQFVFVTYDPGHRTEKSQAEQKNEEIEPNEEEAYIAALEWAEETMNKLISLGMVPGTDLTVSEEDARCGPLMQYGVLVDRRPLYYAVVECVFGCKVQKINNRQTNSLLD
jgi:hypothetical protein